ncbi:Tubby-like F-box protein 6 [Linum perenne]
MPEELLREVLLRIEASETSWPPRKSVVACAGVCRSWRHITKDIVRVTELCGKLTFPISLKQPGPRDILLQCFIKRCRTSQTYYLYLSLTSALADDGKFLLAARKSRRPTCTDYIISLDADDMSKGSSTYVGKLRCGIYICENSLFSFDSLSWVGESCFFLLRSNFLGTKFTVFDGHPPHAGAKLIRSRSTKPVSLKQVSPRVPAGNYPVAHISYELNMLGSRGPRRMNCTMDGIPASSVEPGGTAPTQTEFSHRKLDVSPSLSFIRSKSNLPDNSVPSTGQKNAATPLVLKNKSPRWHEHLQCWCLNFHGRVTVASVKNFQLVASAENGVAGPEHEKIILQFGKVGKDLFTMDYRYPISAFQAFAICLSSFDTKIACE